MNAEEIKNLFTYHPPKPDQVPKYEEIRKAAHAFAVVVNGLTPAGQEQQAALVRIREAVMWANAAIALG
jgi:hypothetical protein